MLISTVESLTDCLDTRELVESDRRMYLSRKKGTFFKTHGILTLPSLFIFEMCVYVFVRYYSFMTRYAFHLYNSRIKYQVKEPFFSANVNEI